MRLRRRPVRVQFWSTQLAATPTTLTAIFQSQTTSTPKFPPAALAARLQERKRRVRHGRRGVRTGVLLRLFGIRAVPVLLRRGRWHRRVLNQAISTTALTTTVTTAALALAVAVAPAAAAAVAVAFAFTTPATQALTHTTQAAASAIAFAFTTPATQALAAAASATALGAALAAPAAATHTSTLAARAAGRGARVHVPTRDASRKPTDAASSRTTLTFAAASLALALTAAATTLAVALTATFHAGQHHLPRHVRRQCVHRLGYKRDRLLRRPAL